MYPYCTGFSCLKLQCAVKNIEKVGIISRVTVIYKKNVTAVLLVNCIACIYFLNLVKRCTGAGAGNFCRGVLITFKGKLEISFFSRKKGNSAEIVIDVRRAENFLK